MIFFIGFIIISGIASMFMCSWYRYKYYMIREGNQYSFKDFSAAFPLTPIKLKASLPVFLTATHDETAELRQLRLKGNIALGWLLISIAVMITFTIVQPKVESVTFTF